jgi:hypothetical protein
MREMLGSNFGLDTGYPEVLVVLLSPSSQMPGYYLDHATIASL